MAELLKGVLTNKGLSLVAQAQAGTATITFTRFEIGNGDWGASPATADLQAATELKSEKATFDISKCEYADPSTSLLTLIASNKDNKEGYYVTEVGVYATDGADDVLYAIYVMAQGKGDWFPDHNSLIPSSLVYNCHITVANAESVTIKADAAGLALETDLEATQKEVDDINKSLGSADYSALASTITEGLNVLKSFKDTTEDILAALENPDLLGKGGYIGRRIEGGGMIFFDYSLGFKGDVSVAPITSNLHTYHVDALTGMVVCDDRSDTSKVDRFYVVSDYDIGEYKHGASLMWSNGMSGTLYTFLGTETGFGTGKANTQKCIAAAAADGLLEWDSNAYNCIWHYAWKGDWQRETDEGVNAWFVPSKDELNVLCNMQYYTPSKRYSYDGMTQLRQLPQNFYSYYWSSSESSAAVAFKSDFFGGRMYADSKDNADNDHVRGMRTF